MGQQLEHRKEEEAAEAEEILMWDDGPKKATGPTAEEVAIRDSLATVWTAAASEAAPVEPATLAALNDDLGLDDQGMTKRDRKAERKQRSRAARKSRKLARLKALGLAESSEDEDADAIEALDAQAGVELARLATTAAAYAVPEARHEQHAHLRSLPLPDGAVSSDDDDDEHDAHTSAQIAAQQARIQHELDRRRR
jgi:hypothetical protein